MHYVSVEGLSKSYGVKPLFSNISFHIEEGDKIAIIARNGAMAAFAALLLGLIGSVIGGWMASGERMTFTHYRTRTTTRS